MSDWLNEWINEWSCFFFWITSTGVAWLTNNTNFSPVGWLDDIGLPQYKTQFDEGRVDGRMLHYMTIVSDWLLGVGEGECQIAFLWKDTEIVSKIHCFHNDSTRVSGCCLNLRRARRVSVKLKSEDLVIAVPLGNLKLGFKLYEG